MSTMKSAHERWFAQTISRGVSTPRGVEARVVPKCRFIALTQAWGGEPGRGMPSTPART